MFGKALPLASLLVGGWDAVHRYRKGDKVGATLEATASVAATVPVEGTAVSLAISGTLLARDMKQESEQAYTPGAGKKLLEEIEREHRQDVALQH